MTGIPCPYCRAETTVIDSRVKDGAVRRRRQCMRHHRFSTVEAYEGTEGPRQGVALPPAIMVKQAHSRSASGYRGVVLDKRTHNKYWYSYLYLGGGKTRYVGTFASAEEAARAYDAAAREQLGDRAILNFPNEAETKR